MMDDTNMSEHRPDSTGQPLTELAMLQQMVLQQQSQITTLLANASTNSTTQPYTPSPSLPALTRERAPKERLPTLRVFNGDRNEWEEWHLAARNKLRADGEAIGETFIQFLYLSARVEGKAAKTVKTYVELHSNNGSGTGEDFLTHLGTIYADPNKKARALQSLYTMRQGDRESFANFLPRFETVLADAGGHQFNAEQQVNYLRNSLNRKIRPYLISSAQGLSGNYTAFVSLCQSIGSELMALEIYDKSSRQPHSHVSVREPVDPQDTMVWEPTNTQLTSKKTQATRESSRKRATWVDKSTLDYRFKNNLCIRCGNQGHHFGECKFLPPKNPVHQHPVKVKTIDVKAAKAEKMDNDDSEESSDELGKE